MTVIIWKKYGDLPGGESARPYALKGFIPYYGGHLLHCCGAKPQREGSNTIGQKARTLSIMQWNAKENPLTKHLTAGAERHSLHTGDASK